MDNSASDSTHSDDPRDNPKPDKKALSSFVRDMETEENLQKLADQLGKEWKGTPTRVTKPDLSFEKFEKKRKDAEGQ